MDRLKSAVLPAALALLLIALPPGSSALATAAAAPLPQRLVEDVGALRLLGQATARFLGFELYDAAMWVADPGAPLSKAYALDLRYARRFKGSDLVETTIRELDRLGLGAPEQRKRWGQALLDIFPDVGNGDRIVGACIPGRSTRFYSERGLLGSIDDPEFGSAFFAIWLDARTRDPSLRARLLGTR